MTVSNGEGLSFSSECSTIPLKLDKSHFLVDLLLLPIYKAELVLGVQWLVELGLVLFDYKQLWMEMHINGKRTRLHGLPSPSFNAISLPTLCKQVRSSQLGKDLPFSFVSNLQQLLNQFSELFSPPLGLPLQRSPLDQFLALVRAYMWLATFGVSSCLERIFGDLWILSVVCSLVCFISSPFDQFIAQRCIHMDSVVTTAFHQLKDALTCTLVL